MNAKELYKNWIAVVSVAIILLGIVMAFFIKPIDMPIDQTVLPKLILGVLGATMMGWGLVILLVARYAFTYKVPYLLRIIMISLIVWYVADTLISACFKAYFNIVLNSFILIVTLIPLVVGQKVLEKPA